MEKPFLRNTVLFFLRNTVLDKAGVRSYFRNKMFTNRGLKDKGNYRNISFFILENASYFCISMPRVN